jgi:hypothetical protein
LPRIGIAKGVKRVRMAVVKNILRVILGGLIAVAAVVATFFAALLVLVASLFGMVVQLFRPGSVRQRATFHVRRAKPRPGGGEDVIDVVTTEVDTGRPRLPPREG